MMKVWVLLTYTAASIPNATMFRTADDCGAALSRVIRMVEQGERDVEAMCVQSVIPAIIRMDGRR